jgi:hypothetical protein
MEKMLAQERKRSDRLAEECARHRLERDMRQNDAENASEKHTNRVTQQHKTQAHDQGKSNKPAAGEAPGKKSGFNWLGLRRGGN